MKKVFLDSIVAKIVLVFSICTTITLGPFVFSKLKKVSQWVVNHECMHAQQWNEVSILSGIFILSAVLVFGIHPAWLFMAGITYYIWYVTEWLIKLIVYRDQPTAYRSVCFEYEAYKNQADNNYLENRKYFSWLKFVFKKYSR